MEKQSYISSRQIIVLLIMTRLPFSTAYYVALNAGKSIQDILYAVPVNFILNFIIAIPILMLLKKYPGKDIIELASNIIGKAAGIIVAVFYMFCFILLAVYMHATFQDFFVNAIIPESTYYDIAIPLLVVAFYGAVKGIEAIARFGSIVIIAYLIILSIIAISLIPHIDFNNLLPVFYNGPQYFWGAVLNGFNSNIQIVFLIFCAPFLKSGTKTGKLYAKWNVFAMLLFLGLEFLTVAVMGPFVAIQNYPLSTLAMQSRVGVFERIDAIDMISWILNIVLMVTFYVYFAAGCLMKVGLNKHKKLITFLIVAIIFAATDYASNFFVGVHTVTLNPYISVLTLTAMILVPFLILIADMIKRRVAGNEKAG